MCVSTDRPLALPVDLVESGHSGQGHGEEGQDSASREDTVEQVPEGWGHLGGLGRGREGHDGRGAEKEGGLQLLLLAQLGAEEGTEERGGERQTVRRAGESVSCMRPSISPSSIDRCNLIGGHFRVFSSPVFSSPIFRCSGSVRVRNVPHDGGLSSSTNSCRKNERDTQTKKREGGRELLVRGYVGHRVACEARSPKPLGRSLAPFIGGRAGLPRRSRGASLRRRRRPRPASQRLARAPVRHSLTHSLSRSRWFGWAYP